MTSLDDYDMIEAGWNLGRPPTDPMDFTSSRCSAQVEGRRCVRKADHLHRVFPFPHVIIFAADDGREWYKEVWGAGA
jgi:hypothetical protein